MAFAADSSAYLQNQRSMVKSMQCRMNLQEKSQLGEQKNEQRNHPWSVFYNAVFLVRYRDLFALT